ncbi:MAG: hypothetical protein V8R80_12075 [Eubacterium sp.]
MLKSLIGFFKSLRFRIFILLLVFAIAPGFVLRAGLLRAYETRAVEARTLDITSQASCWLPRSLPIIIWMILLPQI